MSGHLSLKQNLRERFWPLFTRVCIGAILILFFVPSAPHRNTAKKTVDSSNLRQIAYALKIYASEHNDTYPQAESLGELAGKLAQGVGFNAAECWVSLTEPANPSGKLHNTAILTPDKSDLSSTFRSIKPSFAVVISGLNAKIPDSTPIAWTRGLKSDGTWARHNPYGGEGGHVAFLSGKVIWVKNLRKNPLPRFDGNGMTTNIHDALPEDAKIGEYIPSQNEAFRWSVTAWFRTSTGDDLLGVSLLDMVFILSCLGLLLSLLRHLLRRSKSPQL